MKIVFVTQEDPFYIPFFFKAFFLNAQKYYIKNFQILGIIIQKPLGKKSKKEFVKTMIEFYGFNSFIFQGFRYFVIFIRKILYRFKIIKKIHSIEFYAKENNVEILNYNNVNSKNFINYVQENKIDLIISVAASQIFKKRVLSAPTYGCINIHNAPLPYYRGMLPNFWQMLYGEKYSIFTIHEMNEKLDSGRIIFQGKTKIQEGMSLNDLIIKAKIKNAVGLLKVMKCFSEGTVEYRDIPKVHGSYFSFPTKKDVYDFKKKGYRIF